MVGRRSRRNRVSLSLFACAQVDPTTTMMSLFNSGVDMALVEQKMKEAQAANFAATMMGGMGGGAGGALALGG